MKGEKNLDMTEVMKYDQSIYAHCIHYEVNH